MFRTGRTKKNRRDLMCTCRIARLGNLKWCSIENGGVAGKKNDEEKEWIPPLAGRCFEAVRDKCFSGGRKKRYRWVAGKIKNRCILFRKWVKCGRCQQNSDAGDGNIVKPTKCGQKRTCFESDDAAGKFGGVVLRGRRAQATRGGIHSIEKRRRSCFPFFSWRHSNLFQIRVAFHLNSDRFCFEFLVTRRRW